MSLDKYLILIRNKCNKGPEESYMHNNPMLIKESNYDENYKRDIINEINRVI